MDAQIRRIGDQDYNQWPTSVPMRRTLGGVYPRYTFWWIAPRPRAACQTIDQAEGLLRVQSLPSDRRCLRINVRCRPQRPYRGQVVHVAMGHQATSARCEHSSIGFTATHWFRMIRRAGFRTRRDRRDVPQLSSGRSPRVPTFVYSYPQVAVTLAD